MRVAENKGEINMPDPIDISRYPVHTLKPMEQQAPKSGRIKQPVGYPLRFRSKAQKKRLEEAAKRAHKTLKDFLIDLGEKAAAETDGALNKAS